MILYFSATGNTKYVAQELAKAMEDRLALLRDLVRGEDYDLTVEPGENFGVVMPTGFQQLATSN